MTASAFRISMGALVEGVVLDRPNRFVAVVLLNGQEVLCHVADSGRLKELIYPGNSVMVRPVVDGWGKTVSEKTGSEKIRGGSPFRKTSFDLVLASAGSRRASNRSEGSGEGTVVNDDSEGPYHDGTIWVSVDTRYPTRLFRQVLRAQAVPEFAEYDAVRPEYAFHLLTKNRENTEDGTGKAGAPDGTSGNGVGEKTRVRKEPRSRFDFYLEGPGVPPALVEVKSVTLCANGKGLFPDAPTERGARHLRELAGAVSAGYRAYAVFVAQREDILTVSPNRDTDPKFAEALAEASERGVRLLAYRCRVSPAEIVFDPAVLPVVV
jgi:sugar fermentation stimulation protein A